jgi:hypothetical protein
VRRVRTRRRGGVARAAPPSPPTAPGSEARAWCGPGHGLEWAAPSHQLPADVVELATQADGDWSYRLALHPVTGRPAHDHLGRLVYLPVARVPGRTPP